MFDRYTLRARHVLALAQDEARALGHDHVGAEHILLGLAADARTVPPADPPAASLEELDAMIDRLVDEELELSRRRRIVHGRLEILWAERELRRGQ